MSKPRQFYYGLGLVAAFSVLATLIAGLSWVKAISFSPLIVGIIIGMVYANTVSHKVPATWLAGIKFCTKTILRTGIILYGFRLTLTQVVAVGLPAIVMDVIIIAGTIAIGLLVGRMLKLDFETSIMTSIGSAICGAAAVLGAEGVVKCESHKTAIAVSTVVLFGTLSMFLYPIMYRAGMLSAMTDTQVAIYTGSTLHEVAHVAGAGNAMDPTDVLGIAGTATITKMIRVIMLAPVLLILACFIKKPAMGGRQRIIVPWFAFIFCGVIVLNTLIQNLDAGSVLAPWLYGKGCVMEKFDTFLLTMAMTALGCDTSFDKFRQAGAKPFILAAVLYVWLVGGGYLLTLAIA